jgi:hypothetical protein
MTATARSLREGHPLGAPQSQPELLRERNRGKFIRRAHDQWFCQPTLDKAPLPAPKVQGFRDFLLTPKRGVSGTNRVDAR